MVYKKGAFVAGQIAIVVKAGKDAERMLRSRLPLTEDEKDKLNASVNLGKEYEGRLEKHKKNMGL